ncbi:MAG: eL32 family ribosomal protein, partial [Pyrobaculum sp.]
VHAVRIGRTVGRRKRLEIIKKAKELGLHVLNARE